MARPQNPSPPLSSSGVSSTVWLLWLAAASLMIILGLTLPRWWLHLTGIQPPAPSQQEQTTPSSEVAAPLSPRLDPVITGIILVWLAAACIVAWLRIRKRGPSSQPSAEDYRLAELALPCGCWLQLIHLGERRLLAGHDRQGVRVLLELPPVPSESETDAAGISEAAPPLSSPLAEAGTTDSRTAAILALFQQLKAATQASS
ncbi:MAG: hypothetical protein N3E46_04280 [Gemmataceae bacterium]|nr:hypothetical protein [Gemmataceae bacterium]